MQGRFLEKNTLKEQCWETSREYNQLNGPTAFSSPEGVCWVFVCVQMDLVLCSGVRWHRCRAASTCQWPFPWHSWWLKFVSSVDLREGVSSSISLLSELLLSLWLWVIVNNCSSKCNILGQNHAIGYEKSENRDLCGCSWYRSSGRSWRSESVSGDSEDSFPVSPQNLGWQMAFIQVSNEDNLRSQDKLRLSEVLWLLTHWPSWFAEQGLMFPSFVFLPSSVGWWTHSCIHGQRGVWDHSSGSEEEL